MKPVSPLWVGVALFLAFLSIFVAGEISNNDSLGLEDLSVLVVVVILSIVLGLRFNSQLHTAGDTQASTRASQLYPWVIRGMLVLVIGALLYWRFQN